jgi:glutamate--cysteine ligase
VTLQSWAREILDKVLAVAEAMERDGDNYSAAIRHQYTAVEDPGTTLSARIVNELEKTGSSFFEFALDRARCHRDYFASIAPLSDARETVLADEAAASLVRQAEIEAADSISLDDYLQRYFAAF